MVAASFGAADVQQPVGLRGVAAEPQTHSQVMACLQGVFIRVLLMVKVGQHTVFPSLPPPPPTPECRTPVSWGLLFTLVRTRPPNPSQKSQCGLVLLLIARHWDSADTSLLSHLQTHLKPHQLHS